MESKCPDETAHAWDKSESVQFVHAGRHLFTWRGLYKKELFNRLNILGIFLVILIQDAASVLSCLCSYLYVPSEKDPVLSGSWQPIINFPFRVDPFSEWEKSYCNRSVIPEAVPLSINPFIPEFL